MRRKTETISFRASEDLVRRIDQERHPYGISRGDWVRGAITARLFMENADARADEIANIGEAVHRTEEEVAKLESLLARAVYLVITCASDMSPEEVRDLVREKLISRG